MKSKIILENKEQLEHQEAAPEKASVVDVERKAMERMLKLMVASHRPG